MVKPKQWRRALGQAVVGLAAVMFLAQPVLAGVTKPPKPAKPAKPHKPHPQLNPGPSKPPKPDKPQKPHKPRK